MATLSIRMMGDDHIVIFHHCPDKPAGYVYAGPGNFDIGNADTTRVLLRLDFDKFVEKKFKPLKCKCGLKVTPDEVVFGYFRERIMGGE